MRICLVRLPSSFLINERAFPPLGLMAVGTTLKQAGHAVTIHDGPLDETPLGYDAYGVGPTTPEYAAALVLKDRLQAMTPRPRFVLGGTFATLNPDRCLSDGWDCVVFGDGEPVADHAFTGIDWTIHSSPQPLDSYPISDRTLLNIYRYTYTLRDRPATTLVTSRGCPWACGFCCKTETSARFRSAAHVIQEIDYLRDEFGYRALAIPDDIFILQRQRAEVIAQHLHRRDILWRCLVRGDLVVRYGRAFVQMMADCGCVSVGMGMETGSPRLLAAIHKGETIPVIKQAVAWLKDAEIAVKGFFILGLPGESPETLAETEQFLAEMQLDDVDIKVYQPYPGSPIWRDKATLDIDWSDVELEQQFYKGRLGEYHGNVRTSRLSNAEIVAAMTEFEAKYKHASL